MATFIFALIGGVAAGALTSRVLVRRELEKFRETLPPPAAPAPPVVAAPAPPVAAAPPPQPAAAAPAPVAPTPAPAVAEEITPEVLTVLTAAVAAFLGKRAKIRSARVRGGRDLSSAWAQQGRVFVQASHNLPLHH